MPKIRGQIRPTTRAEAIARAWHNLQIVPPPPPGAPEGTLAQPIGYELRPGHNGGTDPYADHCGSPAYGNRVWTSDCVGLVAHVLGFDRTQAGPDGVVGTDDDYDGTRGVYLNCASMIDDAEREQRYFVPIDLHMAQAGDVLITRDHVELIVRPATSVSSVLSLGCSPRHDASRRAAIGVDTPWSPVCRALRYKLFKDG